MSKIKKNDTVKVLSGKEGGKRGKVLKVLGDKQAVLVERVNFVKRHMRAGAQAGQQGGIIEKEAPIPMSKVQVVCPKCSKPSRIGYRILEDNRKVRYCKRCEEQIES
jgi:large subunit ribosomal protein L24